jgi:hypothetical protein
MSKTQQCHKCGLWCELVPERSIRIDNGFGFYKSVTVHFDYGFEERRFRQKAIVQLSDAVGGDLYEYEAVICRAEKRALSIAERLLSIVNCSQFNSLNSADLGGAAFEQVISWDDPIEMYRMKLEAMAQWADERHRRIHVR